MLIGVASVFGQGTVGQLVVTAFFAIGWLCVQTRWGPYRFTEVSRLAKRATVCVSTSIAKSRMKRVYLW